MNEIKGLIHCYNKAIERNLDIIINFYYNEILYYIA